MRPDLLVPVAIDQETGALVYPFDGSTGVRYRCPGDCGGEVIWRRASVQDGEEVRRSHFAHLGELDAVGCGESAQHRGAKEVVRSCLSAWWRGEGRAPEIHYVCARCSSVRVFAAGTEPTQDAILEHRLPSGRVVDVWCGNLAIEVVHTHLVDDAKASDLKADGVRWIEVTAASVLAALRLASWAATSPMGAGNCPACVRAELAEARMLRDEALAQRRAAEQRAAELMKAGADELAGLKLEAAALVDERRALLVETRSARDEARASLARQLAAEERVASLVRHEAKRTDLPISKTALLLLTEERLALRLAVLDAAPSVERREVRACDVCGCDPCARILYECRRRADEQALEAFAHGG